MEVSYTNSSFLLFFRANESYVIIAGEGSSDVLDVVSPGSHLNIDLYPRIDAPRVEIVFKITITDKMGKTY